VRSGMCECRFVSDAAKAKDAKSSAVKLELMKKKERKKLRKMKSDNFAMSTKAKALWEQCRRFVTRFSFCKGRYGK